RGVEREGGGGEARAQRRKELVLDGGEARFVVRAVGDLHVCVGKTEAGGGEAGEEPEVRGDVLVERGELEAVDGAAASADNKREDGEVGREGGVVEGLHAQHARGGGEAHVDV